MTSLATEIERQPSIFGAIECNSDLSACALQTWSKICSGKNGVVALSGALICFGLGPDIGPLDLRWYEGEWPGRGAYKNLQSSDFIFGCDVFGDLLFERGHSLYRLDGESGDTERLLADIRQFGDMPLRQAAELFGGEPAREAFAGSALGTDPLRLLPSTPFLMAGGMPHNHRVVRLTTVLSKKAELAQRVEHLADGASVDLSFWNQ